MLVIQGCGSPYLFGPIKYGSSDHLEYKDRTRGGLGGEAAGVLYDRGTESIIVGWEHFYDGSSDRIHNHIYRGAVKFNVGLLSEPPKKTIIKSTLNYSVQSGSVIPSTDFILSCATKLYSGKDEWHGIPELAPEKAPDTIAGDFIKALPADPLGAKVSIDVTNLVKDWVSAKKTNHGFVFGATTEKTGLMKNNDQCWTLLGDFTLKVDYTQP